MIKWFKKAPLLHGLLILCTPLFIGLLVIVGLFIYGFVRLFDPNYVEFGPMIVLYKAKNCANPEDDSRYGDCSEYGYAPSIYKNNPPTLYQEIKRVVVSGRSENIDFNPSGSTQWECSVDGRIINDTQEKVQGKETYKCWPK